MNIQLTRDIKVTVSVFQEFMENRTKGGDAHPLEHLKQEGPNADFILQGWRLLSEMMGQFPGGSDLKAEV